MISSSRELGAFKSKDRVTRGFGSELKRRRVHRDIEVGPDNAYFFNVFLEYRGAFFRTGRDDLYLFGIASA
jgi:hypothetical protein